MRPIQAQPPIMNMPATLARHGTATFRQAGATLIISLIVLVLMTLLAVSTFNLGKGNLQIVGNMQRQNEALAAAQEVIEELDHTKISIESTCH